MQGRFRHATHVLRVAALFLVGIGAFLIARWVLIPADFGTLGFYRAGALDDVRARPIAYAGSASCDSCHVGKYWSDFDDAEATFMADPKHDNKHSALSCEACHGPLAFHVVEKKKEEAAAEAGEDVEGEGTPVSQVASDDLCLGCHRKITARPEAQPQVVVGEHEDGTTDECVSCHRPHRPRTDEDEDEDAA